LHRRFAIPGAIENPWEGIIVIVENNGRASALLVDDMVTKQEVVIKPLGGFLQNLAGVSGGAILGDGGIALILDPASLFSAA
jgi:two-component system chemotaxis sensor kinase CheA